LYIYISQSSAQLSSAQLRDIEAKQGTSRTASEGERNRSAKKRKRGETWESERFALLPVRIRIHQTTTSAPGGSDDGGEAPRWTPT
jgi:hypothetical protein